jgi:hypothetical protein
MAATAKVAAMNGTILARCCFLIIINLLLIFRLLPLTDRASGTAVALPEIRSAVLSRMHVWLLATQSSVIKCQRLMIYVAQGLE